MKRLYEIQSTFYAVLDDADDIEASAHLVTSALEPETTDLEVYPITGVEHSWLNTIPYGEADGHTCAWWLDQQKREGAK